jgi:DnaJ-domain-containing protein 1
MPSTYYDDLQIPSKANADQVRTAYRKQAIRWHPDKNPGNADAAEKFEQISEAYAVLKDPAARAAYDDTLEKSGAQAKFSQRIDPRAAAALFYQEMSQLAFEMSTRNVRQGSIVEVLKAEGCPEGIATKIARDATKVRRSLVRRVSVRLFLLSAGALAAGVVVFTLVGHLIGAVGRYVLFPIATLLCLFGAYGVFHAMRRLISGRMPNEWR